MPYCQDCGVEVEQYTTRCPLCHAEVVEKLEDVKTPPGIYPEKTEDPYGMSPVERLRLLKEILNFGLVFTFLIVLAIDLILERSITWSQYVLVSVTAAGIILNSLFQIKKHPLLIFALDTIVISVMLFLLDLFYKGLEWFLVLGLPIVLTAVILTAFLTLYIRKTKTFGLNVPGSVVLYALIMCVGIDILVNIYQHSRFQVGWSMIVLAASIMPAVILLYIHYRVKKIDLKKVFHI